MATKETRLQRGRRRGRELTSRSVDDLRNARITAGLSLATVAHELALDPSSLWRLETGAVGEVNVVRLSEVASVLGFELSIGLHPIGDPVHDKAQRPLAKRFDEALSVAWCTTDEAPFPIPGDQRAWDKLLRLKESSPPYLVGVDLESRIVDIQALVRRTRLRERDGMVDEIVIVLSDTAHNRRLADELRTSLGTRYQTSPRKILSALRSGQRLVGSGVILI